MSDNSHIQWTDATWNPTTGCTKVSPGCANCYIAGTPPFRMAGRKFDAKGHIPLIFHEDRLSAPLRWAKPRRVFVNSLSDLFHEDIPDDYIAEVYGTMVAAYWHEFQVLTKRPARRLALLKDPAFREAVMRAAARHVNSLRGEDRIRTTGGYSRSYVGTVNMAAWEEGAARNIWEGVTVENQWFAEERIPVLLETPAAVRFLSCEPLLGPVDLTELRPAFLPREEHPNDPIMRLNTLTGIITGIDEYLYDDKHGVDWVILGGESGPGARPMDLAWARSLVAQCQAAGVAVFVKQLGKSPYGDTDNVPTSGVEKIRTALAPDRKGVTTYAFLKDRKGGDMAEWPADLRVREFPALNRSVAP